MNKSNYEVMKKLEKLWGYVDRGHLILLGVSLFTFIVYNNIQNITQEKATTRIHYLETELELAQDKVAVLEEEYLYGGEMNVSDSMSMGQEEVYMSYLDKREELVRKQVIPLLTAQIEVLMPKGKAYQTAWEDAGLPNPEEMANIFYDASKEFNHDPTVLIAIAWAESRFRSDICTGKLPSPAGALGCMQIMPQWVDKLDFVEDEKELVSFKNNVYAGAYIFREYLDHRYGKGKTLSALRLYNYGPNVYIYNVKNRKRFNGYAVQVMKKVEELHRAVPVEITVNKTVKVGTLNPL